MGGLFSATLYVMQGEAFSTQSSNLLIARCVVELSVAIIVAFDCLLLHGAIGRVQMACLQTVKAFQKLSDSVFLPIDSTV